MTSSSGALSDVKVLDLSRLLPGGFCSLLLADFGAEVLKVEDTGMGDYVRWAVPKYEDAEDVTAASLGGNVRVGLEDNFYLPDGEMARSNGDLIARARRMAEDSGRRVATVAETRQRLGLRERAALA